MTKVSIVKPSLDIYAICFNAIFKLIKMLSKKSINDFTVEKLKTEVNLLSMNSLYNSNIYP